MNKRRIALVLVASAGCFVIAGALLASARPAAASKFYNRPLTFAERVGYQRAIEEVYWRHRIWPGENPGPKPSLDEMMSAVELEKKVEASLRNSQALEDFWAQPLRAVQLQAEMERMAQDSKLPEVLGELFAALGNDPFVIAECLARPALSERLLTGWYAHDARIHGKRKQRAEAELEMHPGVEQMRQLSGHYSEIELRRSDGGEPLENAGSAHRGMNLSSDEWDATLQRLAATFRNVGGASGPAPSKNTPTGADEIITIGKLSPLAEDEMRFYATAVLEKSESRIKIATITWPKQSLESWLANAEKKMPDAMVIPAAVYTLPPLNGAGGCANDTWTATAIQSPGRNRHTAVWTGSEMIVWGGEVGLAVFSNTGARYNPSTDSWAATSTVNAPSSRADLTAVWTGREMIVWGGDTPGIWFDTGGRYNPAADTWTSTSTANAPHPRQNQTAVWTGSEMIVWGGLFYDPPTTPQYVNTGGKYNPETDNWTATNTANAPAGRDSHTAIWNGTEMIVWGGGIANSQWVDTGGRYNPRADSWGATSALNVPTARGHHTAIWTGSEMIVWGGYTFTNPYQTNTGGRYNPSADSWMATNSADAPTKRYNHTAVWTGNEMIVWGGSGCTTPMCQASAYLNTGATYNPSANSWAATAMTNAPGPRDTATAVWTGSEMIVWGGSLYDGNIRFLNTGGRYCAQPSTPQVHSAVSRKTHGGAGSFEVDLPLSGAPGLECRSGGGTGDYTIVLTFLASVAVSGNPQATVTAGVGAIGSGGVSNGGVVVTSGNVVTIPLTNVANAQTIQVTLNNVNGASSVTIPMRVLIGDVNGNGAVNAADISLTRTRSGQAAAPGNFRADVNADGSINATDVALVKAVAGTALP